MTLNAKQIDDLPKGFTPTGGNNRKERRATDKPDHNNRKGLERVRVVAFPGYKPSKITLRKQYIGRKMILHYEQ